MVATAHFRATEAAVEILDNGGNAFDAAVAAAFALGVCEPAASGLGGQTMMLLYHAETHKTVAVDGSSRAPNRATPEVVLSRADRLRGYRAATVPSTPATLGYVLQRYGRLKLRQVLQPSIRLAREGVEVTALQRALTRRELKNLRAGTAAPFFLREGRRTYLPGTILRQPVLAQTFERLAAKGIKDFYRGQIAKAIHDDMVRNDGLLRRDDLAQIPQPIERRPVSARYEGMRILTFPPPGAGRTLVEMLNVYQQLPAARRNIETPEGAVVLAEVVRRAFLDRQDRPFDPNFFPQVSGGRMLKPDYAKLVARQVVKRLRGHGETTHLCVMDRHGNIAALTQSIERVYGSFSVTPELGFLYNNYMSAFEYEDISHPYYLRPNAVPWASVAPTIVFRGRKPWLAIGSPGSERITPSILQVLLRLQYMTPLAAVDAPRLHCSLKGKVSIEASRMRNDIPAALERHGLTVDRRDSHSFYMGCVPARPPREGRVHRSRGPAPRRSRRWAGKVKLPLLLSVPHAGLRVPSEVDGFCKLTPVQIAEDGDEGAAEIYQLAAEVEAFVTTDVARAIVDLNRAEDDRRPDGVVKTHTCLNVPVYEPFPPGDVVDSLLEHYYRPYHARLRELASRGVRLGIDCHTMLAVGPPIGPLAGQERPRICISDVDGTTCPPEWFAIVAESFRDAFGFEPALNHPFKGGYITRTHAAELPWIQLELSRAGFMDADEKRARVLAALQAISARIR